MADVITRREVRDQVVLAQEALAEGNHVWAMIRLAEAWSWLRMVTLGLTTRNRSPLGLGPTLRESMTQQAIAGYLKNPKSSTNWPRGNESIAEQLTQVTRSTMRLQEVLRLMVLGVDYPSYLRFEKLTPSRSESFGQTRRYAAPEGYAPTEDDVAFCMQFVVSASLRFADAKAHLEGVEDQNPRGTKWVTIAGASPLGDLCEPGMEEGWRLNPPEFGDSAVEMLALLPPEDGPSEGC